MLKPPIVFLFEKLNDIEIDEHKIFLNQKDKLRLTKMMSESKKKEFLTSRLLLNLILSNYFNIKVSTFKKNFQGKPFLDGVNMSMSISHSLGYYAFGFSHKKTSIGIDIEAKPVVKNLLDIAKNYFSQQEYEILKQIKTESARLIQFRQYWSLKESYYKINDQKNGLKNVQNISFDLKKKEARLLINMKNKIKPQFYTSSNSDLSVAVCLSEAETEQIVCLRGSSLDLPCLVESSSFFEKISFVD